MRGGLAVDYLGAQVIVLARHGDTSAHNTGRYGNTTMAVVAVVVVVVVDLKACSEDRGLLTTCTALLLATIAAARLCCRSSIGAIDMGIFLRLHASHARNRSSIDRLGQPAHHM